MARTPHSLEFLCAAVLIGFATVAAVAVAVPAKTPPSDKDTHVDAASAVVDYKTQTTAYKDIVITQDDIKVQADRAHSKGGLSLENSEWTFEGNVRIQSEQRGNLHSDQAVVEFRNNHIAKATVNGSPAEFEQKLANSEQTERGHANEIVYDVTDGTVRLSKDAWLSDGRNAVSAPELVYNIREQRVQGSTPVGAEGRVHITISPNGKIETEKKP